MSAKLSSLAREHIQDIWLYTEGKWGEAQATTYVAGLFDLLETLEAKENLWRAVPREALAGAFYVPYRKHFVFFRKLPSGDLGVLAVLHQRRDIPNQLMDIDGVNGP